MLVISELPDAVMQAPVEQVEQSEGNSTPSPSSDIWDDEAVDKVLQWSDAATKCLMCCGAVKIMCMHSSAQRCVRSDYNKQLTLSTSPLPVHSRWNINSLKCAAHEHPSHD